MPWKPLYLVCHSGLDPESSASELDSRRSLPRYLIRGGNDALWPAFAETLRAGARFHDGGGEGKI